MHRQHVEQDVPACIPSSGIGLLARLREEF